MDPHERRFLAQSATYGPQRIMSPEGERAADQLVARELGIIETCQSQCRCPTCEGGRGNRWFRCTDEALLGPSNADERAQARPSHIVPMPTLEDTREARWRDHAGDQLRVVLSADGDGTVCIATGIRRVWVELSAEQADELEAFLATRGERRGTDT